MVQETNDFRLRVQLLRALDTPQWDEISRVRGAVTLDGELLSFFEQLRSSDEAEWLGPGASPTPGQRGQVFIKVQNGPRGAVQRGYAVQNLDGLLRFDRSRVEVLEPSFLADSNWATGEPGEPDEFQRYRQTVEFTQWLRERADVAESDRLVFLLSEKLELPISSYKREDIAFASFEDISTLRQLLADDLHKDQRRAIAIRALIEMLGGLPANDRFPHLLRNLPDFIQRVKNGYALYVAEFSYERVRDQVEAARIEIAGKLNKTISEIQNQILAIPVATILVATQMKAGTENWATNLALVIASAIFVFLMRMILRNQRDSLSVLNREIDRQAALLRKDYKDVAERFNDVFCDLHGRQASQERRLDWVWYLVLTGFALSVVAAYWFSTRPSAATTDIQSKSQVELRGDVVKQTEAQKASSEPQVSQASGIPTGGDGNTVPKTTEWSGSSNNATATQNQPLR